MFSSTFLPPKIFIIIVTMCLARQVMPNKCSSIGCINTVEDLVANFHCDRQSNISDVVFHFQPWTNSFHRKGSILAIQYRIADKDIRMQMSRTGRNAPSEGPCSPSETSTCRVYIIYSDPMFFVILPRLFYSISFLRHPMKLHKYATRKITNFYWDHLPFCSNEHIDSILQDFSERVSFQKIMVPVLRDQCTL